MNLEEAGDFDVRCVSDPRSAIEVSSEWRPDLILLDMVMPGLNGEDLFRDLQSRPGLSEIPVIFISASASNESIVKGARVEHLPKPMSVDALLEAIHRRVGDSGSAGVPPKYASTPAVTALA